MPVLPKQNDVDDSDRATAVWSSVGSPGNCRQDDDGGPCSDEQKSVAYCCLPTGCPNYYTEPISPNDLGDAVKVCIATLDFFLIRSFEGQSVLQSMVNVYELHVYH